MAKYLKHFWKRFWFHLEHLPLVFLVVTCIIAPMSWIFHIHPLEILKTVGLGCLIAYVLMGMIMSALFAIRDD